MPRPNMYPFPRERLPKSVGVHIFAQRYIQCDIPVDPHDHDFFEIVVVLGGSGIQRTSHGPRALGAGDLIIIRPGSWHAYENCNELDLYLCCFGADLVQRTFQWALEQAVVNYLLVRAPLSAGRNGVFMSRLGAPVLKRCTIILDNLALSLQDHLPHDVRHLGQLLLLLDELGTAALASSPFSPEPVEPHPAVLQSMGLLEANIAHPWTLAELSEAVHHDPSYLGRLFKRTTGISPMACLRRLRAERAAALLLGTDETITKVAIAVGWPAPHYFARRFQAYYGLSATEYRKRFAKG